MEKDSIYILFLICIWLCGCANGGLKSSDPEQHVTMKEYETVVEKKEDNSLETNFEEWGNLSEEEGFRQITRFYQGKVVEKGKLKSSRLLKSKILR